MTHKNLRETLDSGFEKFSTMNKRFEGRSMESRFAVMESKLDLVNKEIAVMNKGISVMNKINEGRIGLVNKEIEIIEGKLDLVNKEFAIMRTRGRRY